MNQGCNLKLACFNVRSLCNKIVGVLELIKDSSVDLCCITESWLKVNDHAIFAEICEHGFDIFSCPRQGKGGGVAFVFNPSRVKPEENKVKKYTSFEVHECTLNVNGSLLRLSVVYRTTQVKNKVSYDQTKTSVFFDQFGDYLDVILQKNGKPIICGDFNFHIEDTLDSVAKNFLSLIKSKGFQQHVDRATHISGGMLDLILTRKNIADQVQILNLEIEEDTGLPSCDHFILKFELPFTPKCNKQEVKIKSYRQYSNIDIGDFCLDVRSAISDPNIYEALSIDDAVQLFNDSLLEIIDGHALIITTKVKEIRTAWLNSACRQARAKRRKAERAFKKQRKLDPYSEKTRECKQIYTDSCVDAGIIIDRERNRYYSNKLESLKGKPHDTYKVVNYLLDKQYKKDVYPSGGNDCEVAENLKSYFSEKINKIYKKIEDGSNNSDSPVADSDNENMSTFSLCSFSTLTEEELCKVIKEMADKSCDLDPIPTWLLKQCLPELKGLILFIINKSLEQGHFPESLKSAAVKPTLKKTNLDKDDYSNYRPVSNLSCLSKIIEKCVNIQLLKYLDQHELFAPCQSGYRKSYSCETAIVKIHNDVMMMIDEKSNVLLVLLDLSAAFDTINHDILIQRLKNMYGINGTVLKWIKSYLNGRSFTVTIKRSSSSSCTIEIGVPQGSILGPLLFILYTKDLQRIVQKYGLQIHLYADDTQIYFSIDIDCDEPDLSQIEKCLDEIKLWMRQNFLKLNDDKTEVVEIGIYMNTVSSLNVSGLEIVPKEKAKNLGFIFDDQLSLEQQLLAITKKCNMNLRNYWKIGSKLTQELKIQLVHAGVLSVIDYCNAVYGGLTEADLQKLQKLQNSAVRFIFGLRGKACHQSISPYLKQLHFLPVRFRIKYKISLLTFKCLNNMAPKYLSDMLMIRQPKMHNVRLDNDFYLLEPSITNFRKSRAAFCVSAPLVWNELPYNLRCQTDLMKFKVDLKTYYFNFVFADIE